jgi:hypothetical protein
VRILAMGCALLGGDVALRLTDEHSDARWFSVDALDEPVLPEPYPSALRAGILRG